MFLITNLINMSNLLRTIFCHILFLLDFTFILTCPIPASGGKICDNNCSALRGRTFPVELFCIQPFFPLR